MKLFRFVTILAVLASALPALASKTVLGKLGQALEKTPIYAGTTTRSRVYYKVQPFEYLVVKQTRKAEWIAVLLQNGHYGYVPTTKVATLPYEVTSDDQAKVPTGNPSLPSRSRAAIANYSLNFLGTPYKWGGTDMQNGVDCSAFMKGIFAMGGMKLPRTAAEQVRVGKPVYRLEQLQPGDRLYFWSSKRNKVGHTGVYLGRGYFTHASSGNGKIVTSYLGSGSWLKTLVAARR